MPFGIDDAAFAMIAQTAMQKMMPQKGGGGGGQPPQPMVKPPTPFMQPQLSLGGGPPTPMPGGAGPMMPHLGPSPMGGGMGGDPYDQLLQMLLKSRG